MKLKRNAAKCLACGTILESKHAHDFVSCGCENGTFIDGGLSYARGGGKDLSLIEDLCEYEDE